MPAKEDHEGLLRRVLLQRWKRMTPLIVESNYFTLEDEYWLAMPRTR